MRFVDQHLCNNTAEADLRLQLTSERASDYKLLMMSPYERANCAMSMGPIAIITFAVGLQILAFGVNSYYSILSHSGLELWSCTAGGCVA